jgi:hypothetical protein
MIRSGESASPLSSTRKWSVREINDHQHNRATDRRLATERKVLVSKSVIADSLP